MMHMLFAPTGCVTPKNRGSNYIRVHQDLLAQMRRDEILRTKDKHSRHLERSAIVKQTGDSP